MKILQVTNLFSPAGGGVPEAVYQQTKHLQKAGHDVTVWASGNDSDNFYKDAGLVVPFPILVSVANLDVTPSIIKESRISLRDFDVIHLNNFRTFQNVVVAHYAKQCGIPYILQAHGSVLPMFQKQGLKKIYDLVFGYRTLQNADRVVAGNEAEVKEYQQMGVPESKIVIIPPFYDTTEYDRLPEKGLFRQKYNLNGKKIILFLGRIHKIKGLDFLLDAFARIIRDDVVLVIAGPDDGYKRTIEIIIKYYGIGDIVQGDNVLFTGMLTGDDKISALVDADVLVQASIYERGAGSPFEAVLCNTPIIVTSGTGAGKAVEKINAGLTVDYGDIYGLRDMILDVIDNPARFKNFTVRANEYIRGNLSWKNGVKRYENLYEEVMK